MTGNAHLKITFLVPGLWFSIAVLWMWLTDAWFRMEHQAWGVVTAGFPVGDWLVDSVGLGIDRTGFAAADAKLTLSIRSTLNQAGGPQSREESRQHRERLGGASFPIFVSDFQTHPSHSSQRSKEAEGITRLCVVVIANIGEREMEGRPFHPANIA